MDELQDPWVDVAGLGRPLQGSQADVRRRRADRRDRADPPERAEQGARNWRVDDLRILVPGFWTVRVEILITDFKRLNLADAAKFD
jgi:hypothetical protein